jgi:molybdopterin-guanine dinucleotide biosynthesis protein A
MPLILPAVLRLMARFETDADVVAPRIRGFYEPLLAIYSTRCLPYIEFRFARGDRKVVSFYQDVKVAALEQAEFEAVDPTLRSFININTKSGLREAERLAAVAPKRRYGVPRRRKG